MIPTADPLGFTRDIYSDYGLLGLVIVLIIFFVLPPLIKRVMPYLFRGWQDERKRSEMREERQVKAMESMATITQAINVTLAAANVRLDVIQRDIDCVKVEVMSKPKRKTVKLQA